ncbi:putative septum site-determining protein MinD [Haematococcus lacustris]|uniref:Putative septum site-determining protein MinD n=2 Tax=Haematococcus lacustris TaxID=44745 RepID=A0A699YYG4_HAELA|nr:putative septum site-determining protein MinD [Haematococcus lacustris]
MLVLRTQHEQVLVNSEASRKLAARLSASSSSLCSNLQNLTDDRPRFAIARSKHCYTPGISSAAARCSCSAGLTAATKCVGRKGALHCASPSQRARRCVRRTRRLSCLSRRNVSLRAQDDDELPAADDGESRIIVVTSGKGGVGKTTSSANIGMSIARLGYKVALIDADIGLRNLDLLLGLENRILYTAIDILEGDCRLDQALVRDKRWKNLALYSITRKHMDELCDAIISLGYQYIIIDCPAGIDVGFINAISPAKEALIVTTPEITSIRDADRVAGLLEANSILNVKLLVNRVRPEMIEKNDMMSVKDVQVIVSTNRGEPLVLQKKLTLSGIAYENAARRLIGKQDYFLDLSNPTKGMFQRFTEMFQG